MDGDSRQIHFAFDGDEQLLEGAVANHQAGMGGIAEIDADILILAASLEFRIRNE